MTRILQQRESVPLPRQSSNNEAITFHSSGEESLVPPVNPQWASNRASNFVQQGFWSPDSN